MVFNDDINRTKKAQRADIWQGDLQLDGIIVKRESTMRYLGVEISESDPNKSHLN